MNSAPLEQGLDSQKKCLNCYEEITVESRFCKYCGHAQVKQELITAGQKYAIVKQLALFYSLDLAICCIVLIEYFQTFGWFVIFHTLFAIVAVTFFCDKWSKNKHLLLWPNFSSLRLGWYIAIGITGSIIVSYSTNWLNETLFSHETYLYGTYASHKYGKILMIFFIAVMPALFEELAYRGYLLERLTEVVEPTQAIFASAFLFAILHMSFISLFWLIPFALFLGYIRMKEKTLWYGVFFHFTFNLTACVLELYKIYGNDLFW